MKTLALLYTLLFWLCETSAGQRVSLSSFLEQKVSFGIDAASVTDAVRQLVEAANEASPGVTAGLKFFYEDSQKFASPQIAFIVKDEKVRRVLDHIGAAYRHEIRYSHTEGIVYLMAARGGEDSSRNYIISKETELKLGLNFADEKEISEKIGELGVLANVESVDAAKRSIVIRGKVTELDYFDMVIMVCGRKSIQAVPYEQGADKSQSE